MKTFPSLADWLSQQGSLSSKTSEEIAALKKSYWAAYHRAYHQHRKKKWKRVTLRLTPSEHQRLTDHASVRCRRINLNTAIKAWALAYLDEQYVPRNNETIEQLYQQIQKIGNNINQVVHSIHRDRKYLSMTGASGERDIQLLHTKYAQLTQDVQTLKQAVQDYFSSPPLRLDVALFEAVRDQPERIQQIREWLDDIEKSTTSNKPN